MSTMKIFLFVVFVIASFEHKHALKCYTCVSNSTNTNTTCFSTMDKAKVPSYTCNKTSSSFNNFLNATHLNPFYVEEALNATEFECVTYTKHIMVGPKNITEVGRGCFPKTHYVNTCQALYMVAGDERYHLNVCNVCHNDNCNSSGSSILHASGFLILTFLGLRIYFQ